MPSRHRLRPGRRRPSAERDGAAVRGPGPAVRRRRRSAGGATDDGARPRGSPPAARARGRRGVAGTWRVPPGAEDRASSGLRGRRSAGESSRSVAMDWSERAASAPRSCRTTPTPGRSTGARAADAPRPGRSASYRRAMRIAVLGPLEVRPTTRPPVAVPGRDGAAAPRASSPTAAPARSPQRPAARVARARRTRRPRTRRDVAGRRPAPARALEPGLPERSSGQYVLRRGTGYALAVARGDVDAPRFADLVAPRPRDLAAGDAGEAVRLLATALGLWRGEPYDDWPDAEFAEAERRRLTAVHARREPISRRPRELLARRTGAVAVGRPRRCAAPGRTAPPAPRRPDDRRSRARGPAVRRREPRRPSPCPTVDAPNRQPRRGRGGPRCWPVPRRGAGRRWRSLVAARVSGRSEPAGRRRSRADADRLAALSWTGGPARRLPAAGGAGLPRCRHAGRRGGALTAALDGHAAGRAGRLLLRACRRTRSSPGGRTLTFGIGGLARGLDGRCRRPCPRVLLPIPGTWGAWLVAAPSPVDDMVDAARGSAGTGRGSGRSPPLDGTSRLLLEGDRARRPAGRRGGQPPTAAGCSWSWPTDRDGRRSRWRLLDVDVTDGTRRDTGIGGVVAGAAGRARRRLRRRRRVLRRVGRPTRHAVRATLVAVGRRPADPDPGLPARPGRACGSAPSRGRRPAVGRRRRSPSIDRAGARRPGPSSSTQRPVRDVAVLTGRPLGGDRRRRRRGLPLGRRSRRPAAGRPGALLGHSGDVVGVEVDAAGRQLATVSLDHTAIIWDMSEPTAPAGRGAADPPRPAATRPARSSAGTSRPPSGGAILPDRPWQPTCSDLA